MDHFYNNTILKYVIRLETTMLFSYFCAFLAAFFWGAGFIGSRMGLDGLDAYWITFFRFLIALLFSFPFVLYKCRLRDFKAVFTSKLLPILLLASFLLSMMMFLQVQALEYTSVANSGFIIILYAFITPILMLSFFKTKLSNFYWSMLMISLGGMAFMLDFNIEGFNRGDFLSLLCALCSALQIIVISKATEYKLNSIVLNFTQMFFISIIMLITSLSVKGITPVYTLVENIQHNHQTIWGLLFMGVFSTALGFFMQLEAQKRIKSHMASLIFLTESPIAAILAFFILGEVMSANAILGACIVMLCIAVLPFEAYIKTSTKRFLLKRVYFIFK